MGCRDGMEDFTSRFHPRAFAAARITTAARQVSSFQAADGAHIFIIEESMASKIFLFLIIKLKGLWDLPQELSS